MSKPLPKPSALRRLIREAVAPHAGAFLLAGVCMVMVAGSTAALAWLMRPVVDWIFVERRADLLWLIGGLVFATFAVKGVGAYGQTMIMTRVGQGILTELQKPAVRASAAMDLAFFAEHRTGELVSRLTTDINAMRLAVSNALTGLGRESLSIVFLVGVMFYQDWLLASVAFVAFPATVIPITGLGRRLRKVNGEHQAQTGMLMTLVGQSLSGIRLVKAYRLKPMRAARAATITRGIRDLIVRAERTKGNLKPADGNVRRSRGDHRHRLRRLARDRRHYHGRRVLLVHHRAALGLSMHRETPMRSE